MLQAGPELIALIVLAVASVMFALPYLVAVVASRRATRSAAKGSGS